MNMFMVTFSRIRKREPRVLNEPAGLGASLIAQSVKNLPAVLETWVQFLGREDPLEEEMATHSSILAWRIPCTGAWWATVHGVTKSRTRLGD